MDRAYSEETLTHPLGASKYTEELVTADRTHGRIGFPSAFTGDNIAVECRVIQGGDWLPCEILGTPIVIPVTVSVSERIPDAVFGCYSIRFGSDGEEAAARSITVHLNA